MQRFWCVVSKLHYPQYCSPTLGTLMQLIGMLDSPYVRRVAISLGVSNATFELLFILGIVGFALHPDSSKT